MSLLTSQSASAAYASRPKDERFPSLDALVQNASEDKRLSAERTFNLKDLKAVADQDSRSVRLQSSRGQATFTHWSFGQLSRVIGAPASYLRELPIDLAAECITPDNRTTTTRRTDCVLRSTSCRVPATNRRDSHAIR